MYADETIWCTQDAIASLFDKSRSTIAEHLQNIFEKNRIDERFSMSEIPTNLFCCAFNFS